MAGKKRMNLTDKLESLEVNNEMAAFFAPSKSAESKLTEKTVVSYRISNLAKEAVIVMNQKSREGISDIVNSIILETRPVEVVEEAKNNVMTLDAYNKK